MEEFGRRRISVAMCLGGRCRQGSTVLFVGGGLSTVRGWGSGRPYVQAPRCCGVVGGAGFPGDDACGEAGGW